MLNKLRRTETNQFIYLYNILLLLLLTTAMCTSQGTTPEDTLVGHNLSLDCKITGKQIMKIDWLFQKSDSDEFAPLNISNNTDMTSDNAGVLTITAVKPNHEGLYRCEGIHDNGSKTNGPEQLNVTVRGSAWFAGCFNQSECPRPPMNVSLGSSIVINISLFFHDGGSRGVNQEIEAVRLKHSGNLIFACISSINNCAVLSDTNRISYTGQRSPWTNITVTIDDSVFNDSGRYEVEVQPINPIDRSTSSFFSQMNITITEAISPSTTHISSSSSIITTTITSQLLTTSTSTVSRTSTTITPHSLPVTTTTAQSSSEPTTVASTLPDTAILVSMVLIAIVLVSAVLFISGALGVILYVKHVRKIQSKKKPMINGGSIHPGSTVSRDIIPHLELRYNSKLEQV